MSQGSANEALTELTGGNISLLRAAQKPAIRQDISDRDFPLAIANITVSDSSPLPLYEQISRAIRSAICSGDLPAGALLPTGRDLAAKLGISRNTAVTAYARLAAEGYLLTNRRRGTRVSNSSLGATIKSAPSNEEQGTDHRPRSFHPIEPGALARRAVKLRADRAVTPEPVDWSDPALYPRAALGRLLADEFLRSPTAYGPGSALDQFQQSLAAYLRHMRGVQCEPAQIIPVAGYENALNLVAQVLIDPGHYVYLEDPAAPVTRQIMSSAGANVEFMKADGQGASVGSVNAPPPRLIVTSPSVGVPYGHQMSEQRRAEMLDAAERWNCVLLESDTCWELAYVGDRMRALQGRGFDAPVIYFGSLTEMLGSHVKVGYLIVPRGLVGPFSAMAKILEKEPAPFILGALAKFIANFDYSVFVKTARSTYASRLLEITAALRKQVPGALVYEPAGGLRLVLRFEEDFDEWGVCQKLGEQRVGASPLSRYFGHSLKEKGIVLAFGNIPERDSARAAGCLAGIMART